MNKETAQKILEETRENYNQIAEYFSATRVWPWKVMNYFFSYLKENDRIIDIGCGNGRLYEAIKDKNIDYLGVDNSEKLIEKAKNRFKSLDSRFKFMVADALDLPFQNEEFDTVFMMAVLPHIPSRELQIKALKNAYRVLKKKGYIFITCWNLWQPKMIWRNFRNRFKNKKLYQGLNWDDYLITWKSSERKILSQRFYHAFTKKELKDLLEKAGFEIENIFYEYKGEESNWFKGFNLVVIARKF